jgi:hypothetical protein
MNNSRFSLMGMRPSPQQRQEIVARIAFEKWVTKGCPTGSALQDWKEAEAEIDLEIGGTGKDEEVCWPRLGDS